MSTHAGFDTSTFPGLSVMDRLKKNTNLEWCGFYLEAPSHTNAGWMPHRGDLVDQGWGIAPTYVGQQIQGPGSHVVTAAQGKIDGADAAAQMKAAGFPKNSFCFLDLENGPPFPAKQQGYVQAWCDALQGDYLSGIYCSFLLADAVSKLVPDARLWVFHVPSIVTHAVPGTTFPAPDPAKSGFANAHMFQREMACLISVPNGSKLLVDLDTAASADPSQ